MALTNEDLLAISQLLDVKLQPLKEEIHLLKLQNENELLPRLQNIEACYTSTFQRYQSGVLQIEAIQSDVNLLKKVVTEHSETLQKIS